MRGKLQPGGWLGIDPGASGAIAYLLGPNRANVWRLEGLTPIEILDTLRHIGPVARKIVLERVNGMPGDGGSRAFKFGRNYGHLEMALLALGLPFDLVAPSKWQGALGCLTGGEKRISREFCQRTHPGIKITDKEADAILLAEYAKKIDDSR